MNFENFSSYAWLAAGAAGVTAFWNQISALVRGSFTWFLTTANLEEDVGSIVITYLRRECRELVLGQRTYGLSHFFIRTTKKWGAVAVERSAKGKVFMRGWLPVFVTVSSSDGKDKDQAVGSHPQPLGGGSKQLTITSLRWFFDFERFMADAVDTLNRHEFYSNKGNRRYYVTRIAAHREHGVGSHVTEGSSGNSYPLGIRTIGYDIKDLGEPIPESPFKHLAYPKDVNDAVARAKDWLESKDWYEERIIPWRLGMLFKGLPGTGKTSCAKAVAQTLDLPVYVMDLTTMGNDDLVSAWEQARSNAPCMILLEDLDRVSVAKDDLASPLISPGTNKKGGFSFKPALTLDCLLNCISGIERSDGMLVVATANDASKLDQALTRPGRMDVVVDFPALDDDARMKIAARILPDDHRLIFEIVDAGKGETGAQFTKRCADKALELYWSKK